MKALHLYPVVYSKAKTTGEAKKNLKAYPEQGVNCPQAFKHSMEFNMTPGGSVGTLSEYASDGDMFIIHYEWEQVGKKTVPDLLYVKKVGNKFIPCSKI
jgi:hypothetical protein